MRIYIESTIPSYLVARPARDLLQAARQQLSRDWWDLKRDRHIANAAIQAGLRRLADSGGFTLPVICTPEGLMDDDDE